eukprot:2298392-Rhodomonas_salina.1
MAEAARGRDGADRGAGAQVGAAAGIARHLDGGDAAGGGERAEPAAGEPGEPGGGAREQREHGLAQVPLGAQEHKRGGGAAADAGVGD